MNIKPRTDSIGYLFVNICKVRRNKANELLSKYGIHAGQDILLYQLMQEDGQTVSGLVEKICVQHATLSNMVNRMECNGLVARLKDDNDMRVSRIFLTDRGKEAIQQVRDVWREMEQLTIKGLETEERILLRRLLQHVLSNFD